MTQPYSVLESPYDFDLYKQGARNVMDPLGALFILNQNINLFGVMPMVDNQNKKIAGYTEDEIALMNECKRSAIVIGGLCTRIENTGGIDKRWAAIAKTDLQKGFMALVRSIAKPETF